MVGLDQAPTRLARLAVVTLTGPSPIRYLSREAVLAAMPPVEERLALAERALVALVADADMPPKIGIQPRPEGSFGHAMPAWLRGQAADGSGDLLGIKWVTGFPANAERGLDQIAATVVLNDPTTGLAIAILDGGPVTAQRTAAVTGVAIARFGPRPSGDGEPLRVALLGAGVQARSHVAVLAAVLPGAHVVVADRHPERAIGVVRQAGESGRFAGASTAPDLDSAVRGAQVVIGLLSFGPERQHLAPEALADAELVVAVDYDVSVSAATARESDLFLVDERGQFLANRDAGLFAGYPDPAATLGEAIRDGTARPGGRVMVTHLGVGLADVVFADAILRRAVERGLAVELTR
jgi:ornithine cyclodeaminase/alanine dehydrogenase-like protein (mu-crystallin family)